MKPLRLRQLPINVPGWLQEKLDIGWGEVTVHGPGWESQRPRANEIENIRGSLMGAIADHFHLKKSNNDS